jgi:glycosyltransferase involved in cell wall biosynthesis
MKIAILTNAYPPDGRGGAERIALLQAEGLASRGHEVAIWVSDNGTGDRVQGAEVVHRFSSSFPKLSKMSAVARLFFHLGDLSPRNDVMREIIEWKPDVLITHNLTGCGIGTGVGIQRSWVKWIHVLHDVQLTEPSGQVSAPQHFNNSTIQQFLSRTWRTCWSFFRRSSFGTPDVLVSPSKWLLDWHHQYGFKGKKEIVLPNPVEMGEARERALRHPATIAFVGRLSEDKGLADVLKMIPKLDPAIVGSIVIVGDGPLAASVSSLNDSRIDLRLARSHDEARRVIAEADLLVAPSRIMENQPTVILEAMAEGTPVIATDVGGVRELIDGTGASVIAVTDNLGEHLAHEVKVILGDAERWATISRVLRRRAGERHRAEKYLDQLLSLLR